MKPFVENVMLGLLIIISLYPSCDKHPRIPCNPELKTWAEQNVLRYKSASCSDFILLPLDKQRALFALIPAEKQCELWKDRMYKEQMSSSLSGAELQEYLQFLYELTPYDFSGIGEKQCYNKTERFLNQMKNKYHWDENKEFIYLHTWLTEKEYSDAIILQILSSNQKIKNFSTKAYDDSTNVVDSSEIEDPKIPECECIYDAGCGIGTGRFCEKGIVCEAVQRCGIIPNHSYCVGRCM